MWGEATDVVEELAIGVEFGADEYMFGSIDSIPPITATPVQLVKRAASTPSPIAIALLVACATIGTANVHHRL